MSKKLCGTCKKNVTAIKSPGISCTLCKTFFHFTCQQVSNSIIETVQNNSSQLSWLCNKCNKINRRSSIILGPLSSKTSSSQTNTTEQRLKQLTEDFEHFKATALSKIEQLETLLIKKTTEVHTLTNTIQQVELKTDQIEQHVTEKNLEIQGIPESVLTDPFKAILKVAAAINCEIKEDQVDCSVSYKSANPILIVTFNSASNRQQFLQAGKHFNRNHKKLQIDKKHHKIYVNEQLTRAQKKLLYKTKQFALHQHYKFAWFCNGLIHLKQSDSSHPIIIRSENQLINIQNEIDNVLPERSRYKEQDVQPDAGN